MKKFLILVAWLLCQACSQDAQQSPEQQIRATLAAIEAAAQERSLSNMIEYVSDSYKDHEGRSMGDVGRTAQLYLLANQQIHIFTRISSIEVTGNLASVELSAAMAASAAAIAEEEHVSDEQRRLRANTMRFSLVFTLEGDDWRITSSSWQRGW